MRTKFAGGRGFGFFYRLCYSKLAPTAAVCAPHDYDLGVLNCLELGVPDCGYLRLIHRMAQGICLIRMPCSSVLHPEWLLLLWSFP